MAEEYDLPGSAHTRLTVLAGPTAVGKGTISADVRRRYPQIWLSTSVTTRPPRPGEREGKHYHFISAERFEEMRDGGELLEWAVVHGRHCYGTPLAPVLERLGAGEQALLEIDLQGARQVRERMPDARFVFLAPPSFPELERRLIGRGTEAAEEQERRLATAKVEMAAVEEFDHIIVNDDIARATDELVQLMTEG